MDFERFGVGILTIGESNTDDQDYYDGGPKVNTQIV